jgi:RHS repeat-associated protein
VPTGVTTPTNTKGRIAEASTDNCLGSLITDEWFSYFSYDADGNKTDIWGETPNSGTYYHTQATFYGNGAVNTLKIASPNSYTQTYGLDGEGRPKSLTSSAGPNQVIVSGTTYNAAGQPTSIAIGSGTDYDGYAYDSNTGRMTNWTFQVGTNLAQENATLTWNPMGSLKSLAITDGFNSGGTQTCNFGASGTMGYDDLNRLVYDDCGSGGWGQSFSYDSFDNVSKTILPSHTGISFSPGYNTSSGCSPCNNQYVFSFLTTYDSNGNILHDASSMNTYAWNEFSKMKSVNMTGANCATSGECMVYDAFGRAVEIDSGSTYTEILYSQLGKTVYLNGGTIKYAYWPTPGGGTLLQNPGSFYYEHKDWLGNARISSSVANESIIDDRAFAPYGEIYATYGSTAQNENIFTGDTQDIVSGMYDTSNRELVANQGRWMSPDPAQMGWNSYAYATNPNGLVDPSGLGPSGPGGVGCEDPSDKNPTCISHNEPYEGGGPPSSMNYDEFVSALSTSLACSWITASTELSSGCGPRCQRHMPYCQD